MHRRIINCGITDCHSDQTVVYSLLAAGIPVTESSKSPSPAHDLPFSHYRCRRKLLAVGHTQTAPISPRAPTFAKRWIGIRRRHHDGRSNYSAIDLETEQAVLNNNNNLFRMHGPLNEIRSSKTNIEAVISHVESQDFVWQR